MKYNRLGKSAIFVSDICMGTMTFGAQTDEKTTFKILDKCFDSGIDFYDCAEMYPIPPRVETAGISEQILGRWMKTKDRDALIIATKVSGPGHGWFPATVRGGKANLDRHHIMRAVEGSLQRLQTDYIDLYQTHWPDHDLPYDETLYALDELVQAGKVRIIGCSNETTWGLTKSLGVSERLGVARYETIQNSFSLINRRFDDELAQASRQEQVSLIPYSPLGGGVLSGKYNEGARPEKARFSAYLKAKGTRQEQVALRYVNERSLAATLSYQQIAKDIDMSMITMTLAWSKQHDFVASTITGVSKFEQLDEILAAAEVTLDKETMQRINAIHKEIPNPTAF